MRVLLWLLRKAAQRNQARERPPAATMSPRGHWSSTMHYDAQLVLETEGTLHTFASAPAEVLLGGQQEPSLPQTSLDALASVLPRA